MTRRISSMTLALAAASLATPALAQQYPAKPVRIVVPYAAGGNTDFTARSIAEKLTDA
jgi:tripartite-type tricarboxylate transporter receptor subunit TctC